MGYKGFARADFLLALFPGDWKRDDDGRERF